MMPRILFVDDELQVLNGYKRSLRAKREVWAMDFEVCPHAALERIRLRPYDTVVSDVKMPGMTGLELLQHIKDDPHTSEVPVVIVTGDDDKELKAHALDLGAADLLNKPIHGDDLIARLNSSLRTKRYADELKRSNELLELRVQERTAELSASRFDIIWRLGKAAEYRDEETGNHVIRVGCYSRAVAEALQMPEEFCNTILLAAPLHDIGKIGIPDAILLKPGKLTEEEWLAMRSHCQIGASILTDKCKFMPVACKYTSSYLEVNSEKTLSNPVMEMATTIAISHHEKWDGSGYPAKLAGENIPLVGRIVALPTSSMHFAVEDPTKSLSKIDRALTIISEGAGAHFDPQVVDAFKQALPKILTIEEEFGDDVLTADAVPVNLEVPSRQTPVPCE